MSNATYEQAMDAIRDQMAGDAFEPVKALGAMLTEWLAAHPGQAGAFTKAKKTLRGAWEAMEKYAKANRAGASCVCVPPDRALEIALEYYGISGTGPAETAPEPAGKIWNALDLDALLEGL